MTLTEGEVCSLDPSNDIHDGGDDAHVKDSECRRGSVVAGPALGAARGLGETRVPEAPGIKGAW